MKNISFFLSLFLFTSIIHAQYLWLENETNTENILYTNSRFGTFSQNETNPNTSRNNTNTVGIKFIREANESKGFSYFNLYQPIETATTYTISLKGYIDVDTNVLGSSPTRLRVYLKNTTTEDVMFKQLQFSSGKSWENFSFVFEPEDFTSSGLSDGGYNQMYIGYGNGINSETEVTYYIDQIYGTTQQSSINAIANTLRGSWGGRLYVRGGEDLDDYVDNRGYDYIAGAQDIVDNYPSMGHVITNATNNANAQLWTLRTNPNVDAVMGAENSIIDEEFVPSLANEQVIINVIDVFKKANKKVILYLNSQSPANRATDNGAIAWNNYVDTYFAGNGHAAWMNLCEGYIKRFKELGVDGYWLDSYGTYNVNESLGEDDVPSTDAEKNEFVQMIRNIDPFVAISANFDKDYFENEDGDYTLVDSDKVEDEDERAYKIIKMTAVDPWSDFTAGHITPLAQGAPPNSWGYEEFTVTDIEESSISSYDGTKQTVKHLFLPIRERWSSERTELLFDGEQGYRFLKRITDAGGSVTFSNTTDDGTITDDEKIVLDYIEQQFAVNAPASEYTRPLGAFLTNEEQIFPWYENEEDTPSNYITVKDASGGNVNENLSNPFKTGINTSNTVTKFTRDSKALGRVFYDLPNPITDISSLKVTLDGFINRANPSSTESQISVSLVNSESGATIQKQLVFSQGKNWEHLEFDFNNETNDDEIPYNQLSIDFANQDNSSLNTIYYVDNLKGSINQYNKDIFTEDNSDDQTLSNIMYTNNKNKAFIYPNPVINSFKLFKAHTRLEIYNILGNKVLDFLEPETTINVSNLQSGLYLIKCYDENGGNSTLRFIKE